MSSLSELMNLVPIDQVAQQLGVDTATAQKAVEAALPTLVGGLEANAKQPEGASSLLSALGSHGSLVSGGVDVSQIDVHDGAKIVNNIFGQQTDQVVSTLGNTGGADNDLIKRLLPILAPIVMAYLARKLTGGTGGQQAPQAGGGVLEEVLGGMLRGGQSGGQSGGLGGVPGGALGQVLGGMLGGGKR